MSKVRIHDKNEFILDAAKVAMHALIVNSHVKARDPRGIAEQAGKHAYALWLQMRVDPHASDE